MESSSHLTEIWAAVGGGVGALTLLRPLFIFLLDKFLFPNIDAVFDRFNRETPALLEGGTGENVYNVALDAIKLGDRGAIAKYFQKLAFDRFMAKYRFDINVDQLRKKSS